LAECPRPVSPHEPPPLSLLSRHVSIAHRRSFPPRPSSDLLYPHCGRCPPMDRSPPVGSRAGKSQTLGGIGWEFVIFPHGFQRARSEEHTSNSSHVKISYSVFCLKKKITI